MFRRVLQPTYHQLTKRCLIDLQSTTSNPIGRRYLIKKIFNRENGKSRTALKVLVFSFTSGLAVVTYLDYKKQNPSVVHISANNKEWDSTQRKVNESKLNESLVGNYLDVSILDNLRIDKHVDGKNKLPGKRLVLLQYTNCPFCCKVRTFLTYYGIPFDIVEVNPVTRKQIKFSSIYRKVPILLIEDEKLRNESNRIIQLNDSSSIISVLGTYLFCNPKNEPLESVINKYESLQYVDCETNKKVKEISNKYFLLYGETLSEQQFKQMEKDLLDERKFRKWTDEVFVHVLSPNIYRTTSEALQAFNYFSEVSDWDKTFSSIERFYVIYIGSIAMYLLSKYLKKKYLLKEDVRQSLYDDCNYFLRTKGGKNKFMGGSKPNLGDLSVFGVLSSIEGCDAFQDLLKNTNIQEWYFSMKKMVDEHKGSDLLKI